MAIIYICLKYHLMNKDVLVSVIFDQRGAQISPSDVLRWDHKEDKNNEIIILSGVRRCGKSTLMHEIRSKNTENDYYINFDDERLLNFSVQDFQLLYEVFIEYFGNQKTFYFDEIQNIKGWERFVRRLHDDGNKVFITGSNASMLSRELGTHLTGRYFQFELYPFSFYEFLQLKGRNINKQDFITTAGKSELKRFFNEYFTLGGFPAYLKNENKQYLKSLYESIIYRDVLVRNGLTNEREMMELIYYLASNISKPASYNSLSKVIDVKNATTVKNYLDFIQNTYLLFLVNMYSTSLKQQLYNPKKVYFIDIVLSGELGFHHTGDNGRLLENIVFLELKRQAKEIYYHRQKKECDFVIRKKAKIVQAIQVTWSISDHVTRMRETDGIKEAMDLYGLNEGLILTDSEEEVIRTEDKTIYVQPAWKWLLESKDLQI